MKRFLLAAVIAALAGRDMGLSQVRTIVAPPGSMIAGIPFTPGIRSGELLFVAGTMGTDLSGRIVAGGIEEQTKKTLENIGAILKAGNMDFKDVVSVNVYLTDARNFDGMNKVYREFFKTTPPVRATVQADLMLPEGLVEISAIAVDPALPRQVISPAGWPNNPLPYSRAIKVGDYLFLAGLVSQEPKSGAPVPGNATAQTKQIMENAKVLVESAGFQMSDMTVSRVWLDDARDFQAMNEVYRTYFGETPPTRATVRARLTAPVYRVEVMLWGMKGPKQRLGTMGQTPLSQAIKVGNRLFVSGIVVGNAQTRGDAKAQTRAALQTIGDLLKQGGMDFSNAVEAQVWVSDLRHFGAMNEVYREFIKDPPTRATIGTQLMSADGLIEISMIATK